MVMYGKDRITVTIFSIGVSVAIILFALTIFKSVALSRCTTSCSEYLCNGGGNGDSRCKENLYPPLVGENVLEYFIVPVVITVLILVGTRETKKGVIGYVILFVFSIPYAGFLIWVLAEHFIFWNMKGVFPLDSRAKSAFTCGDANLEFPDCAEMSGHENASKLELLYYDDLITVIVFFAIAASLIIVGVVRLIQACRYNKKSFEDTLKKVIIADTKSSELNSSIDNSAYNIDLIVDTIDSSEPKEGIA